MKQIHFDCEYCQKPLEKPSVRQKYHKDCSRKYSKEYRECHADIIKERARDYQIKNKEKLRVYNHAYYLKYGHTRKATSERAVLLAKDRTIQQDR